MKRFALFATTTLLFAACAAADATTDAGTALDAASSPSDAGSAGPDCTPLANSSTVTVAQVQVAAAPPTPAGGTIADGTYSRTASQIYTGVGGLSGPSGDSTRQTVQISGGGKYFKSIENKNGGADSSLFFSMTSTATSISATQTCTGTATATYGFDATPTVLKMHDSAGGKYKVQTYTKQ